MKKKIPQLLLILLLTLSLLTACRTNTQPSQPQDTLVSDVEQTAEQSSTEESTYSYTSQSTETLPEQQEIKSFNFTVIDDAGNEESLTIFTEKTTVGEALQELELIEGEIGDYGLYVKTVKGKTFDYDIDRKYWAFYINDEYAMTSVDNTEIQPGAKYTFKVQE